VVPPAFHKTLSRPPYQAEVVVEAGEAPAQGEMEVSLADGEGPLGRMQVRRIGMPVAAWIADLNHDGHLEVIVAFTVPEDAGPEAKGAKAGGAEIGGLPVAKEWWRAALATVLETSGVGKGTGKDAGQGAGGGAKSPSAVAIYEWTERGFRALPVAPLAPEIASQRLGQDTFEVVGGALYRRVSLPAGPGGKGQAARFQYDLANGVWQPAPEGLEVTP
jgi:hypothetical protein